MLEINHQQQQQLLDPSHHDRNTRSGRMKGSVAAGGEIVEVEGGHIIRSIGRKDRHSKVCTAKGPRDRRVRLSAQINIQFYDVQDRLGYDRPSKALDWLIKKAKAAIDELAELPPWHPTTTNDQFHVQMEDAGEQTPAGRVDSGESPSSKFAFGGSTSFTPPSAFCFPIASSIADHGGGDEIINPDVASSSLPPDFISAHLKFSLDQRAPNLKISTSLSSPSKTQPSSTNNRNLSC